MRESVIFQDGMKKIAWLMLICTVPPTALATNSLLNYLNPQDETILALELIKIVIFFLFSCAFLFYFIYAVTYTVIGSNTKIIFKVFARKKVILFRDITTFKLRAYYPTGYYQFIVTCCNQSKHSLKITISKKNVAAFIDLLTSSGIRQL